MFLLYICFLVQGAIVRSAVLEPECAGGEDNVFASTSSARLRRWIDELPHDWRPLHEHGLSHFCLMPVSVSGECKGALLLGAKTDTLRQSGPAISINHSSPDLSRPFVWPCLPNDALERLSAIIGQCCMLDAVHLRCLHKVRITLHYRLC